MTQCPHPWPSQGDNDGDDGGDGDGDNDGDDGDAGDDVGGDNQVSTLITFPMWCLKYDKIQQHL